MGNRKNARRLLVGNAEIMRPMGSPVHICGRITLK
jgi:hypothetical protein